MKQGKTRNIKENDKGVEFGLWLSRQKNLQNKWVRD